MVRFDLNVYEGNIRLAMVHLSFYSYSSWKDLSSMKM